MVEINATESTRLVELQVGEVRQGTWCSSLGLGLPSSSRTGDAPGTVLTAVIDVGDEALTVLRLRASTELGGVAGDMKPCVTAH